MSNPFHNVSPALITFLEGHMQKAGCCAHDIAHVYRVANLALSMAQDDYQNKESDSLLSFQIIYLTGLLHDVIDTKLYKDDLIDQVLTQIKDFLSKEVKLNNKGEPLQDSTGAPLYLNAEEVEKIFLIIRSIGYKNLINPSFSRENLLLEYLYVQDSDLLDAIGNIGVARCMAYSGKLNRPLFGLPDPDALPPVNEKMNFEKYKENSRTDKVVANNTAVAHFFEKLLRIRSLFVTDAAKRIGAKRHETMLVFLRALEEELIEAQDPSAGEVQRVIDQYI